MNLLLAFFKLLRWPNLVFLAATQFLFYHSVFSSLQSTDIAQAYVNRVWVTLLLIATVLIAGAGYVINDYFDVQIDQINKPDRVYIDQPIKRRWAIIWHAFFSLVGLYISWLVSRRTGIWTILIGNIGAVMLLWFYSTHLKRLVLVGNLAISLLTAWSILVIYFFSGGHIFNYRYSFNFNINFYVKITVLYAAFAFILTLVREVVKDMEDMQGDLQHGCQTMPIKWGVNASKLFAGIWLTVAAGSLTLIGFYLIQKGFSWLTCYLLTLLVLPIIWLIKKIKEAKQPADYRKVSLVIKFVMFAGILTMIFFKF